MSEKFSETGLEPNDLIKIRGVFTRNAAVESVLIFGSRALGLHHSGSDIDLVVSGKQLKPTDILKFRQDLEALHLPWFFDLVHYDALQDFDVKEHIDRVGIKIWPNS